MQIQPEKFEPCGYRFGPDSTLVKSNPVVRCSACYLIVLPDDVNRISVLQNHHCFLSETDTYKNSQDTVHASFKRFNSDLPMSASSRSYQVSENTHVNKKRKNTEKCENKYEYVLKVFHQPPPVYVYSNNRKGMILKAQLFHADSDTPAEIEHRIRCKLVLYQHDAENTSPTRVCQASVLNYDKAVLLRSGELNVQIVANRVQNNLYKKDVFYAIRISQVNTDEGVPIFESVFTENFQIRSSMVSMKPFSSTSTRNLNIRHKKRRSLKSFSKSSSMSSYSSSSSSLSSNSSDSSSEVSNSSSSQEEKSKHLNSNKPSLFDRFEKEKES